MPFRPNEITQDHVLRAVTKIESESIPLIPSIRYDVFINGKPYPPKEIMRYAHEQLDGEKRWEYAGGPQTFRFLERLGFEVKKKVDGSDPIIEMIDRYKKHINETKLEDELYKWQALKRFQGRPDLEAPNFGEDIGSVDYKNLMYQTAKGVIKHIAKEAGEEYRQAFKAFFDESIPLQRRLNEFNKDTLRIYREVQPNERFGHYHDERTMATLLTYHDPEKYTFYKDSFYKKYCDLLTIKPKKTGEKYAHYLDLIDDLVTDYIADDEELLTSVNSLLTDDCIDDLNHKILAQDILYQMLDKGSDVNYWVFQANPNKYDLAEGLRTGVVDNWTVSAHKDKIKVGDKVIVWSTGKNAGCYALAEVSEDPRKIGDLPDAHLWKAEDGNSYKAGIKVTHNLVDNPILHDRIRSTPGLQDLKVGTQGTNFTATKQEYDLICELIDSPEVPTGRPKYWLYAPGKNASHWEQFYREGIMALGWNELGDLRQYATKKEIGDRFRGADDGGTSKKNDSLANFEFLKVMEVGDIVIPKRGRSTYLGYGIVESDYLYDDTREEFKSVRRVNWKKKGEWQTEFKIVVKTLTDISKYPDYVNELREVLGIGKGNPSMKHALNQILYGPPGTGKTYNSIDKAVEIVDGHEKVDGQSARSHAENKLRFDELRRLGQIEFVTFHQNYAYEEFVVGLRPDVEVDTLRFQNHKGIFYQMAKKARDNYEVFVSGIGKRRSFDEVFHELVAPLDKSEEVEIKMVSGISFWITEVSDKSISFRKQSGGTQHTLSISTLRDLVDEIRDIPAGLASYYIPLAELIRNRRQTTESAEPIKNFVLIIDEINRANISKVFGELLTLLEEDKRLGAENELRVTLPNGEKEFGIPPNLFVIGTMNTADKSIALIDIALRRRFDFVGYYPRYDVLTDEASDLLRKINYQIFEKKKSADYLIGHAYFMSGTSIESILRKKVIPLLTEYFAGKTDIVSEIFKGTTRSVSYNTNSFEWEISEV